jgi:hypothetical protein
MSSSPTPGTAGASLTREGASVPAELKYIWDAVERSREMLTWEDDWDGEGSPGYADSTWRRAVELIYEGAVNLYDSARIRIAAPSVLPGPHGSIDIQWQQGQRRLLINVPAEPEAPITFYGDDRGGNTIEGSWDDTAGNKGILVWLTE